MSPDQAASGLAVARAAAAATGREPTAVSLAIWAPVELSDASGDATPPWERGVIAGTADQLTAGLVAYAAAGATAAVLVLGGGPGRRIADLERISAEVVPALPRVGR